MRCGGSRGDGVAGDCFAGDGEGWMSCTGIARLHGLGIVGVVPS